MIAIEIGQRFGRLTVQSIHGRGVNRARLAKCICDCGRPYEADIAQMNKGITWRCRNCANPKWFPEGDYEYHVRHQYHNYRNGARRRGYDHELSLEEFRKIYLADCNYCGAHPAKGVDRRDNAVGYLIKNCVPCCKHCNLAKRDMPEQEFLSWVARIAAKQGFSL